MPSPIAKYFSRALKIVKFREITIFSPAGPISGTEVPTWWYFAEIRANPLFFFVEGGTKNRDIENRLHKPFINGYTCRQLRKQKMLRLAQPQSILVGL